MLIKILVGNSESVINQPWHLIQNTLKDSFKTKDIFSKLTSNTIFEIPDYYLDKGFGTYLHTLWNIIIFRLLILFYMLFLNS